MEIKLKLNDKRQGSFYIEEENELVAEMVIRVEGPHLTVYHTEVAEKAEGKGYAKLLLNDGRLCKKTPVESNAALPFCACTVQTAACKLCRSVEVGISK